MIIFSLYVSGENCCLAAKLCPTFLPPYGLYCPILHCPWDFPDKITGVDFHFLLHETFLTQGLNSCLLHWQVNSFPLSHQEALVRIISCNIKKANIFPDVRVSKMDATNIILTVAVTAVITKSWPAQSSPKVTHPNCLGHWYSFITRFSMLV